MNKLAHRKSLLREERGVTLIQLAIGLVVVGVIAAPVLEDKRQKTKRDDINGTKGAIAHAVDSINIYHSSENGAYPCPASLTAKEGDANFGHAIDCDFKTWAAKNKGKGKALGLKKKDFLADIPKCSESWSTLGVCKTSEGINPVIIGAVPFADLKLHQRHALDMWGKKLLYAVTYQKTDSETFGNNTSNNVLRMKYMSYDDTTGKGTLKDKPERYEFIVLSTGPTGIGGYTKDGVQVSKCLSSAKSTENENCDFDDTFLFDKDPSYRQNNATNESANEYFFDDITRAQLSRDEQTWFEHPDNDFSDPQQYVITTSTRVGIGTADPDATLHVVGNLYTEEFDDVDIHGNPTKKGGVIKSDQLCNEDGNRCTKQEYFTGAHNNMKCDYDDKLYGNQAVMRLGYNRFYCNAPNNTSGNPINSGYQTGLPDSLLNEKACNAGDEVATGISATGEITCALSE